MNIAQIEREKPDRSLLFISPLLSHAALRVKCSDSKKLFSLFLLPTFFRTEHKYNKAEMQTDPEGTTAGLWWSARYTFHARKHACNLGKSKSGELVIAKLKEAAICTKCK